MVARTSIAAAALSMRGTPFVRHGRVPGVGLDCVGLVVCAVKAAGGSPHDFLGYGEVPRGEVALREIALGCDEIATDSATVGDVVCFQCRRGVPIHFGVLVGNGLMAHVDSRLGRVSVESMDQRWQRVLHSAWRVKGVD